MSPFNPVQNVTALVEVLTMADCCIYLQVHFLLMQFVQNMEFVEALRLVLAEQIITFVNLMTIVEKRLTKYEISI